MGSLRVSLEGPSEAAVHERLEKIVAALDAQVSPMNAARNIEVQQGAASGFNVLVTLVSPSLRDDELAKAIIPFEDERVDPLRGVRVSSRR